MYHLEITEEERAAILAVGDTRLQDLTSYLRDARPAPALVLQLSNDGPPLLLTPTRWETPVYTIDAAGEALDRLAVQRDREAVARVAQYFETTDALGEADQAVFDYSEWRADNPRVSASASATALRQLAAAIEAAADSIDMVARRYG